MKRYLLFLFFIAYSVVLFGQENKPRWSEQTNRETFYPSDSFITGFVSNIAKNKDNIPEVTEQAIKDAQKTLLENIRIKISSQTQSTDNSQRINGKEQLVSTYSSLIQTAAEAEIVGIKTESYYDKSTNTIYAFACVNKYELIGYYKSNLSINIGQIESFAKTAQDLEANGEKPKAKQQLEMAKSLFTKVRYAQDLLTAVDPNIAIEELKQAKSEQLYNTLTQMQARLAQGVYVYIESSENLFGTKLNIATNQIKAELAKNGCSFTDDPKQADFKISLNISTREIGKQGSIVFVASDTQVELYDTRKQKTVYTDEIAHKGSSMSQEKAGRIALNNIAPIVIEKLKAWLNN